MLVIAMLFPFSGEAGANDMTSLRMQQPSCPRHPPRCPPPPRFLVGTAALKRWWLRVSAVLLLDPHIVSAHAVPDRRCEFHFDPPLPQEIVRVSTRRVEGDVLEVTLDVSIRSGRDPVRGSLVLVCPMAQGVSGSAPDRKIDGSRRLPSPGEIIRIEDSAGRYFRHVAWERRIAGPNWTGKVAYVDFMFGDGQKAREDYLLMCHSTAPAECVEYMGDWATPLSPPALEAVLNLMRALHFRGH